MDGISGRRVLWRGRLLPGSVASASDFVTIPAGQVAPEAVLAGGVSLYALDDERRQAVFVQMPAHISLNHTPFLYRTQYENAVRLFTVPYSTLHELADALPRPTIPPILIFSMGRAGTTLLGHALNRIPGMTSLPEPDVFTQLAALRLAQPERGPEWTRLVESCTRLLIRGAGRFALKFRSMVTEIIDLFAAVFPASPMIFLYREALAWVRSNNRILTRFRVPEPLLKWAMRRVYGRYFPWLAQVDDGRMSFLALQGWAWSAYMARYLDWISAGVPLRALRYETLAQQPEPTLDALFDGWDLPRSSISPALGAFQQDSQAGSYLSRADLDQWQRKTDFSPAQRQRILNAIAAHPRVCRPDFALPYTINPSEGSL